MPEFIIEESVKITASFEVWCNNCGSGVCHNFVKHRQREAYFYLDLCQKCVSEYEKKIKDLEEKIKELEDETI